MTSPSVSSPTLAARRRPIGPPPPTGQTFCRHLVCAARLQRQGREDAVQIVDVIFGRRRSDA
jgi:hypothetical protein